MKTLAKWVITDSGKRSGAEHMQIDRQALNQISPDSLPTLRFFEWNQPVVTYGYLMNAGQVQEWAQSASIVQRPTGGGVVHHQINELALSLLWPRGQNLFPEAPRDCYQAIHQLFLQAIDQLGTSSSAPSLLSQSLRRKSPAGYWLYNPDAANANCAPPNKQFSVCFNEPVCNDVMLGDTKVIGGALRITKNAILYQGTIQVPPELDKTALKDRIWNAVQ